MRGRTGHHREASGAKLRNSTAGTFTMKHLTVATALLALLPACVHAAIIPDNRLADWRPGIAVGVVGGIPTNRTNLIDVTLPPYNADSSGSNNAAPAIQAAINAAMPGQVVFLKAGKYRLDAALILGPSKDGITLRGAGMDATILDCRANPGIYVGSGADYRWNWPESGNVVTGTRNKGTTTLAIPDTTAFSIGQMVHIKVNDQQNEAAIQAGAVPVVHVGSWREARSMKARITGKTAASLTISPGLYFDCTGLTTTINSAQYQSDNVGVEDLTVDGLNGNLIFGVHLEQCYGSWIKGVKVNNSSNYAFYLTSALNCEVRQSFANSRKTAGSNGAGILFASSSACLIEDNIVYKFFPLIEVNFGATGNVIAYNYLEDSSISGAIGAGTDTNHGPHNSYNLYEGNITPNFQADGYFGSVSEDTIFRNWAHGSVADGSASGFFLSLNRFTRNYSIVGNIFGRPGQATGVASPYSLGYPNMGNSASSGTAQPSQGNFWKDWATMKTAAPGQGPGPGGFQEMDLDVQATTLLKGNYNYLAKAIPANETLTEALPPSLYRSAKPAWFGALAWPPFDPANPNPTHASIPAGQRFANGGNPPAQPPPSEPPPSQPPPSTPAPSQPPPSEPPPSSPLPTLPTIPGLPKLF